MFECVLRQTSKIRSATTPDFGCTSRMPLACWMAATSTLPHPQVSGEPSATARVLCHKIASLHVTSAYSLPTHSLDGRGLQWTHASIKMPAQKIYASQRVNLFLQTLDFHTVGNFSFHIRMFGTILLSGAMHN